MRRAVHAALGLAAALALAPAVHAQEAEEAEAPAAEAAAAAEVAKPVDRDPLGTLLRRVRASSTAEGEEDAQREAAFLEAKQKQEGLALRTEALVRNEEALSIQLEDTYTSNEELLVELDNRLTDRIGQMGELFGVVRLVATDLSGEVYTSLTSLGVESRQPLLDKLGRNTGLPSTEDMEKLWFQLLREMTAQGQIQTERVPVIVERPEPENEKAELPPPVTEEREVTRAGPFVAFSRGEYLQWAAGERTVEVLERQPPPRYSGTVEGYESGGPGFRRVAVDPSRGALLFALTGTPSLLERVNQGGYVGYTIVLLGLGALALGLFRFVVLTATWRRVAEQMRHDKASPDNPLGRLLGTFAEHEFDDSEMLEMRLDESLLRESSGVKQYLWVVQTISIIAPLLGLLGTVTGMIQTFQAITLFGAGDPKIMAGGISEALVTTTLGLVTAIPLVLLHSLLASRASAIVDVLEERRAALVAAKLEKEGMAA